LETKRNKKFYYQGTKKHSIDKKPSRKNSTILVMK